jgi:hypothetical protein
MADVTRDRDQESGFDPKINATPRWARRLLAPAVSGLSVPEVHCRNMQHEAARTRAASGHRHEGTVTRWLITCQ